MASSPSGAPPFLCTALPRTRCWPLSQPPQGILQTEPHLGEIEILDSSPTPTDEADIPVRDPKGSKTRLYWGRRAEGCARTSIQILGREPGRVRCGLQARASLPPYPLS